MNTLRFCYECKNRRIVDGLPKGELKCVLFPQIKIFNSTEANQCILNSNFEEIII